jgi:hypothetical protein
MSADRRHRIFGGRPKLFHDRVMNSSIDDDLGSLESWWRKA